MKQLTFLWIALSAILSTGTTFAQSSELVRTTVATPQTSDDVTQTPSVYTRLTVQITGANGLGQWEVSSNPVWRNSGDTARVVAYAGQMIRYSAVAGWIAPNDTVVTAYPSAVKVVAVSYRQILYGTLKVHLIGGNTQGQWSVDGGTTWRNSDDTVHLESGFSYNINYKTVNAWETPPYNYVVMSQNDTTINATYTPIQYAWFKVKLTGANGLGRWSLNNSSTLYRSNDSVALQIGGSNYIYYTDVNGFVPPNAEYVTPTVANQTITLNRNYYLLKNIQLKVYLTGANGQGRWTIDGSNLKRSGDSVLILNRQTHYLATLDVAGFIAPSLPDFRLETDRDTSITLTYIPIIYKNVRVNIIGGGNQGLFNINNGSYQQTGTSVSLDANTGRTHSIVFKPISGWITPNNVYFQFANNQDTTFTGTYIPIEYGVIKVNLSGANNNGQWTIGNTNILKNSGDTMWLASNTNMFYYIYYKDVSGWIKPSSEGIQMTTNKIDTLNRAYIALKYSVLKVHLTGANNLGQWQIGDNIWHNSDDTVHVVYNDGRNYTIYYKTVAGWIAPNNDWFVPTSNAITFNKIYTAIEYGILKVDIIGGNGSGRWAISGGNWHNGGDTLHLPTNRLYNVYFENLTGWILPTYIYNIEITPNQTKTYTATYTWRGDPIIKVNISGADGQARWYLNSDGSQLFNSGDSTYAQFGYQYYIGFKRVLGWNTPPDITFNSVQNVNRTFDATYTMTQRNILTVKLIGGQGEGRWSVDNKTWLRSGDTLNIPIEYESMPIYLKQLPYWSINTNPYYRDLSTLSRLNEYTFKYTLPLVATNLSAAIAPNPANDYINYSTFSTDTTSILQLKVFNTLGEIMLDDEIVANGNGTIKTTDFPNGFYFINIYEPKKESNIIKKIYVKHR